MVLTEVQSENLCSIYVASLGSVQADTQTWDITATQSCVDLPEFCATPFTLNAQLSTVTETGIFDFIFEGGSVPGTFPVETGISGTFNGMPISFMPPAPNPFGIDDFLLGGLPEGIQFETAGITYFIDYEGNLIQIFSSLAGNPLNGEAVAWNMTLVATPEPPLFWLFLTALLSLGLSRWAQTSLRKLSGR